MHLPCWPPRRPLPSNGFQQSSAKWEAWGRGPVAGTPRPPLHRLSRNHGGDSSVFHRVPRGTFRKCEVVAVQIRACVTLKPDTSVKSALRWLRLTDLPPLPKGHGRAITDASEGHRGGEHPYGTPDI